VAHAGEKGALGLVGLDELGLESLNGQLVLYPRGVTGEAEILDLGERLDRIDAADLRFALIVLHLLRGKGDA